MLIPLSKLMKLALGNNNHNYYHNNDDDGNLFNNPDYYQGALGKSLYDCL